MATTTDGATAGDALTAETLAAMEAAAVDIAERGVQSVADALLMADVIVDNPDGDVEWLIAHGCDVADHLRREVRRLTAALDGVRLEERERVVAAVAKVREGWPRVEGAPDELAMSAARMALSEVADAWDALAPATGSAT